MAIDRVEELARFLPRAQNYGRRTGISGRKRCRCEEVPRGANAKRICKSQLNELWRTLAE